MIVEIKRILLLRVNRRQRKDEALDDIKLLKGVSDNAINFLLRLPLWSARNFR